VKSVLVLLSFCAWLQADQLFLKNGDRVSGAITKKDGAKLTVKSDLMGEVTMSWDQVERVQSDKPVYVTLPDGRMVNGTLTTADGKLEVAGEAVAFGEVAAIRNDAEYNAWQRLQKPSWLDLWTGTGSLGFAGTQGNAETQTFTTAFSAARTTLADKTSVRFNAIRASAFANNESSQTADAVRGGIGYDRNVNSRLFVSSFNDYEYDRFQNLDLRFVLGGGMGYKWKQTARTKFDILAGGAYNRENFGNGVTRNSAEGYWGNDFSYKLTNVTTVTQTYRMFNNLTNTGQYRINFDAGATTKLTKWLTWNVAVSDRFLSNPVQGRERNDFIYSTGLGFTFAR
jgi:putative salt-induced outer membrane protein